MARTRIPESLQHYTDRAAGMAIGARLRRLSERIDHEAMDIYSRLGERFEQRWFGVVNLLDLHGPLSVGELADALGISHASVSQTRDSLQNAKLVAAKADAADARRRTLDLTPKGKAMAVRLRRLWNALAQAAGELDEECGGVVAALGRLEHALDERPLAGRVAALLPTSSVLARSVKGRPLPASPARGAR
jgi:MarR family transcriptional regulator, organic hydroperoxide resistance regulator